MGACPCETKNNINPQQEQNITNNQNTKEIQNISKNNNIEQNIHIIQEINPIANENVSKNFELKNSKEIHNDNIIYLIELYNKKIMTCSYDKTTKIFDLNNLNCEKIIINEEIVMCLLEFVPDMVLFGLQSGSIELLNIKNPEEKKFYFKGHLLYVNSLVKIDDNFFASASNDTYIRIWIIIKENV